MDHETELLQRFLDEQRHHVLGILEGLTEEQLTRPLLPSGWHCLGLVKHLALADEHYWFRCVVAGESRDYFPSEPNGDWRGGGTRRRGTCSACTARRSAARMRSSPAPISTHPPRSATSGGQAGERTFR